SVGYWDCCKPSCAWPDRGNVDQPIKACSATGNFIDDALAKSSCDGGEASSCTDGQPFDVEPGLSMGFTAAAVGGVSGLKGDANCGQCFELVWTDQQFDWGGGAHPSIVGKRHVVQVTNIGYDVSGDHSFDLQIPGAGQGQFSGCVRQYGNAFSNGDFDCDNHYGGCSDASGCSRLPQELQAGCEWRYGHSYMWLKPGGRSNNPFVRFRRVQCPKELIDITGSTPNDD
ncbi:RlpA-like double-psi beta-barrel-protein domain-containing protein-containing protein, partial [Pelagophyceae sp. CCMP2097]